VKKNHGRGGAESGIKFILKVSGTITIVKKNHGLGEAESEKNSYRTLERLKKM
jgi:hypothetical protein